MNKLQEIIAYILDSPLSEKEKIDLISKVNKTKTEEELNQAILEVADYFEKQAGKFEQTSSVYEKYLKVFEDMNKEVEQLNQKYQPPPSS